MPHIVCKSHPAPANVLFVFISAVVLPVPPAEPVCPDVAVSQKQSVKLPPVALPASPPAEEAPLTALAL